MKIFKKICLILLCASLMIAYSAAKTEKPSTATPEEKLTPSPLALLTPVPTDKLIIPEEGFGNLKYGDSVDRVEKEYGRGELLPDETDREGNNYTNLIYKDKGLIFKFFNGHLAMIIVDKPGYATKTGVQVGCEVGDIIREFGTKFSMQKSIVQDQDPSMQDYEMFYKNIAVNVKGKIIKKIRIMTSSKFKSHKK